MDRRKEAESKEIKKSGKPAKYERRGRWYRARNIGRKEE
jgi:hypothetical protein